MSTGFSNLKRHRRLMPDFVKRALEERGLISTYPEPESMFDSDLVETYRIA